ncbi:MAG: 4-(cytidine 5'-diphospho)-2-C-methyl-D-erythritol kinase [Alphaproteobacteria bacterium]|nr:4-(cytidine 5'-diphospho)-2-C-methyl-D-erythritol kinase [Alphaproteobacteria bacterium]
MLTLFSPAKINLFLHITGRLANGYHTLETMAGFCSIGDSLHFKDAPIFSVHIQGPCAKELLNTPHDDLSITKAATLLANLTKHPLAATVSLDKQLPVASGIGGGSTNAATTFLGLNQVWGTDIPLKEMEKLGLTIGADVPMCIYQKPVLVKGMGDIIEPLGDVPPLYIILANPTFPVPTPLIYNAFKDQNYPFSSPLSDAIPTQADELLTWLSLQRNDLQATACHLYPEIDSVISALSQLPGCRISRMSGSGATCFGLFADERQAHQGAADLKLNYPKWWVKSGVVTSSPGPA